jgi:20S proteasome subunit beta 7
LGQVDLFGTQIQDDTLATGYGAYMARPLLRKAYRENLTEEEAKKVISNYFNS